MSKYYIDKETRAHTYYTLLEEADYSFLLNNKVFKSDNFMQILYKVDDKYIEKEIRYSELADMLKNKDVIVVIGKTENYTIRVSAGELWVHSNSKQLSNEIFNLLNIKSCHI